MLAFGMQVLFVGFLFIAVLVALIIFPNSQLLREGAAGLGLEFLKGIVILGGAIGIVVLIITSCADSDTTYDSYDRERENEEYQERMMYNNYIENGGDPDAWPD